MKFVLATVLPAQTEASTFYMISSGAELLEIHVTNADNSQCRRIPLQDDFTFNLINFSEEAPSFEIPQDLWWDTSTGTLFVKYANDGDMVWVEAIPSVTMPEFAGNGVANTMSRSDHWHEGVMVQGDFTVLA